MALTPNGLPYPVGTDKVIDGDDAIRALALAIDPRLTPNASDTPVPNGVWTIQENTLARRSGFWYLHLRYRNSIALVLPAGAVQICTIPVAARVPVALGTSQNTTAYVSLAGGAVAPLLWGAILPWSSGALTAYNPTATPSQPTDQCDLRLDAVWPAA